MTVNVTGETAHGCHLYDFVLYTLVVGALCVLGLIGNITSCVVLWMHKMESATIFLLQVLAIVDSLLLVTSFFGYSLPPVYNYTGTMQGYYHSYEYIRKYIWPPSLIAHTATIWLTVLVTFNRHQAVCEPIGPMRTYAVPMARIQVIFVLIFSILYNIPRFFEHQTLQTVVVDNVTTSYNLGDNKAYQVIYSNVIYYPVMYILPLSILTYLNVKLIKSLRILNRRKEQMTGHRSNNENSAGITVIVIVIVCMFIVCQTPALVNQIFWAVTSAPDRQCGQFHFYFTKISDTLVVLNSSINFVIYCLFGKTFRKIFYETLCPRSIQDRFTSTTYVTANNAEMETLTKV